MSTRRAEIRLNSVFSRQLHLAQKNRKQHFSSPVNFDPSLLRQIRIPSLYSDEFTRPTKASAHIAIAPTMPDPGLVAGPPGDLRGGTPGGSGDGAGSCGTTEPGVPGMVFGGVPGRGKMGPPNPGVGQSGGMTGFGSFSSRPRRSTDLIGSARTNPYRFLPPRSPIRSRLKSSPGGLNRSDRSSHLWRGFNGWDRCGWRGLSRCVPGNLERPSHSVEAPQSTVVVWRNGLGRQAKKQWPESSAQRV